MAAGVAAQQQRSEADEIGDNVHCSAAAETRQQTISFPALTH
jgi:hypothetical protein